MKRREVRDDVVWHQAVYGSLSQPGTFQDDTVQTVIAWLQECLNRVPAEYHGRTYVNVESVSGYEGEHHAEVSIYYLRPETDHELANREQNAREDQRAREAKERALLAELRKKYG